MGNASHAGSTKGTSVSRWWRNWIGNRSAQAELDRLDVVEMAGIARDIGATPTELRSLAGKWPDAAEPLMQRMKLLKLEPAVVAAKQPAAMREMTKLCSLCATRTQCSHDLASHSAGPAWRRYCPNSATLLALVTGRGKSSTDGR
jgi:hypothetical protein